MNQNTFFLYVTKYATTITNVAISLRDISIPPKNKTIQHKTAGLFCFHKNVLIYKLGQDYLSCPQDVGQSYPNQKPRLS